MLQGRKEFIIQLGKIRFVNSHFHKLIINRYKFFLGGEHHKKMGEIFFLNEVAITDAKGNIVNFNLVYKRYGQLPELVQLEKTIFVTNSQRTSAKQCAINAIQGGIVGLLQKKSDCCSFFNLELW